jgi:hypothetical protein
MSAPKIPNLDLSAPPIVKTIAGRSLVVGVVFGLAAAFLVFSRPEEFYRAYLLGYMCWLGVAIGSMSILMIRHLTGGGWGMVIRRILGAAMRTIPVLTVLFIPIALAVINHNAMYPWLRPLASIEDEHLRAHLGQITKTYLNPGGFLLRAAFYFAVWNLLSFFLTRWSREQDQPNGPDNTDKFKALSGPGLILIGLTISFAGIDWVMSLDPSWISTIFGLIILITGVLSAMCFAVVVERILVNYKPMSEMLQESFVHDHGKWMLVFTMVWAYFNFSQWLIIWNGNLPSEITYYLRRLHGGWERVGLFLVLFHFAVPFAMLLSRSLKRDIRRLVRIAVWLLLMTYVDLFWIIEPNFSSTFKVTPADIIVPVAIGGLWLAAFFHRLGALPLLPAYDPAAGEVFEPTHY